MNSSSIIDNSGHFRKKRLDIEQLRSIYKWPYTNGGPVVHKVHSMQFGPFIWPSDGLDLISTKHKSQQ